MFKLHMGIKHWFVAKYQNLTRCADISPPQLFFLEVSNYDTTNFLNK